MGRYQDYRYDHMTMIPVAFDRQILPGSFDYSLSYLVDHELDLKAFDQHYRNDNQGRPAYDPRLLLKIVILAYATGITSSRQTQEEETEDRPRRAAHAGTPPRAGPPEQQLDIQAREAKQIAKLRAVSRKLKHFLEAEKERVGASGAVVKGNVTDNESAKMKTSHGVIQGYTGVAAVDSKHQIVVPADAFCQG